MLVGGTKRNRGRFNVTVCKGDKRKVFPSVGRETLKCYVVLGNYDDRVNESPTMIEIEEREEAPLARPVSFLGYGSLDSFMSTGARVCPSSLTPFRLPVSSQLRELASEGIS
jgi:hypothetical protein